MDKLFILAMVEEYYEENFKSLENGLANYDWMKKDPLHYISNFKSDFCGIVMFVQKLGVDFESVNSIYEKYYNKFREMEKKAYDLKAWKKQLTF